MLRRIHSLTQARLTVIGFVLAALPLATGIITAMVEVDRFARSSRGAVVAVQRHTDLSRKLASEAEEMVRSARQYVGLGDEAYRDIFEARHREVLRLLDALVSDSIEEPTPTLLQRVRTAEQALVDQVYHPDSRSDEVEDTGVFSELGSAIEMLLADNRQRSLQRADRISEQAENLQQMLMAQAMLVIPLSAILALTLLVLIALPMRKLGRSIHRLGQGDLEHPIEIRGTRDVVELGQRLDWLRQRLLELEQQKVLFLRNVSHELKTPLTNIRESCELLVESESPAQGTETQDIVRILRDNSVRLQAMIEDLLRYGVYLEDSSSRERIDVDVLVADIVARQRLPAKSRSIRFRTVLTPLQVYGCRWQLEVVVGNLLSNAFKYSPRGGEIVLQLYPANGGVQLDVSDAGPGVQPEHRARLFDWFFTGLNSQEELVSGTGMGLAIAREYAQRNGGDIQMVDTDAGACFRLTLNGGG